MRNLRERVEVSRKENLFLPCLMLQNQQLELSKCCNFSEYLEYVIRCRQNLFSHPKIIFSINFWNVDLFKITTWEKIHSCFVKNPFHFFSSYPHAAPYFNIYYRLLSKRGGGKKKSEARWNFYFRRPKNLLPPAIPETIRAETTFARYLIAAGTRSSTQLPPETRQKPNVWLEHKVAAYVAKNIRMEFRVEERRLEERELS